MTELWQACANVFAVQKDYEIIDTIARAAFYKRKNSDPRGAWSEYTGFKLLSPTTIEGYYRFGVLGTDFDSDGKFIIHLDKDGNEQS